MIVSSTVCVAMKFLLFVLFIGLAFCECNEYLFNNQMREGWECIGDNAEIEFVSLTNTTTVIQADYIGEGIVELSTKEHPIDIFDSTTFSLDVYALEQATLSVRAKPHGSQWGNYTIIENIPSQNWTTVSVNTTWLGVTDKIEALRIENAVNTNATCYFANVRFLVEEADGAFAAKASLTTLFALMLFFVIF